MSPSPLFTFLIFNNTATLILAVSMILITEEIEFIEDYILFGRWDTGFGLSMTSTTICWQNCSDLRVKIYSKYDGLPQVICKKEW